MDSKDLMDQLIRRTRKENITLFIGAGFSKKAGAPSVYDINKALIEEEYLPFNPENNPSLQEVSEEFVKRCGGRNELINILKKLFNFNRTDLTDHLLLSSIPHFNTIFTTNYDTLIEENFQNKNIEVISTNYGVPYDKAPVKIYKVHGDLTSLNNPDHIVITKGDYDRYFTSGLFTSLWEDLKHAFKHSYVVFIGYSLSDDNILNIISRVKEELHDNQKGMYLIAPCLDEKRLSVLEDLNVRYINDVAYNYFTKLTESLKDNIVDDFNQGYITLNVLTEFCDRHGLVPNISIREGKSHVDGIRFKNDNNRKEIINFTVKSKKGINDPNVYTSTMAVENSGAEVPAVKFESDVVLNFEYRANGIRIMDTKDFGSILLAPIHETKFERIRIPNTTYNERVLVTRYNHLGALHIDVDTPLYVLQIIGSYQINGSLSYDVIPKFKKEYVSPQESIKWIDFLKTLFIKGEFYLGESNLVSNGPGKVIAKQYERHKIYYELVQKIENFFNVDFIKHEEYNERNLLKALYVYLYLSGEKIEFPLFKSSSFTWKIPVKDLPFQISVLENGFVHMSETRPPCVFNFNGIDFSIPPITVEFLKCKTIKTTILEDGLLQVEMKNLNRKREIVYCNRNSGDDTHIFQFHNINNVRTIN